MITWGWNKGDVWTRKSSMFCREVLGQYCILCHGQGCLALFYQEIGKIAFWFFLFQILILDAAHENICILWVELLLCSIRTWYVFPAFFMCRRHVDVCQILNEKWAYTCTVSGSQRFPTAEIIGKDSTQQYLRQIDFFLNRNYIWCWLQLPYCPSQIFYIVCFDLPEFQLARHWVMQS